MHILVETVIPCNFAWVNLRLRRTTWKSFILNPSINTWNYVKTKIITDQISEIRAFEREAFQKIRKNIIENRQFLIVLWLTKKRLDLNLQDKSWMHLNFSIVHIYPPTKGMRTDQYSTGTARIRGLSCWFSNRI